MRSPASTMAVSPNMGLSGVQECSTQRRLGARPVMLVARRELALMLRGRAVRATFALLLAVAWLPPLLLSLRGGTLRLASFHESVALALAFGEIALPLAGLLAGADLLAGECEDGTLIPLIALPLSRAACLFGKFAGRAVPVVCGFVAAFGSAALVIGALHGFDDFADYAAVGGAGLVLCLASAALGAALGRAGRGRTRAFGAALVAWIVMVFVLDAAILAAVVAFAPSPPEEIGIHGYGEMSAQMEMMKLHSMDDDAGPARRPLEAGYGAIQWVMALDPVDLFRLTVLSGSPTLAARARAGVGDVPLGWMVLGGAWLAWLVLPLGVAYRRFRRADLR